MTQRSGRDTLSGMRWWLIVACLLCCAFLADGALAEPASAESKAAAEALFEEGKALRKEGKCAAAIPKFEQSLALDPGVGTLLRLADCFEQENRLASAWGSFRHAASLAMEQEDPRRAEIAKRRASELKPRLAHLTIDFGKNAGIPGLVVRRGTVELEASANRVALPVDAGVYDIVVTAPDYEELKLRVTIVDGEDEVVGLPPLYREAELPPPSPDPEEKEPEVVEERVVHRYGQRLAALVLGAGSVGTGVVAAILLGVAAARDSEADLHCDGLVCRDLEGEELSHEALELANLATAGFVVAGASAVGALVLYLTAPPAYERIVVTPSASLTSGGLEVRVRW